MLKGLGQGEEEEKRKVKEGRGKLHARTAIPVDNVDLLGSVYCVN